MPGSPPIESFGSQRPDTQAPLLSVPPTSPATAQEPQQPRWARIASSNGWLSPDVLYLMEHAAALEVVQELVEVLSSVLPFDEWLLVAHAANTITDDVTARCPCHPAGAADDSVAQDGLW